MTPTVEGGSNGSVRLYGSLLGIPAIRGVSAQVNGIVEPALDIAPEVAAALAAGRPIVGLESTLITHGLPWPVNLETAREAEAAVRAEGAVPATIALWQGRPRVGLTNAELETLAQGRDIAKAGRRDLALMIAQGRTATTTVSATMFLAHHAGMRLLATGGIGGVHRPSQPTPSRPLGGRPGRSDPQGVGLAWPLDISADLWELAHTPVCVVCSGVKAILDIPATLEALETCAVPVVGYCTAEFPAFYVHSSGERLQSRVDTPEQAARFLQIHWQLSGAGAVLAQASRADLALQRDDFETALDVAEREAGIQGIRGKELTPFLLARITELTRGKALTANRELVVANARLAAQVAVALTRRNPG